MSATWISVAALAVNVIGMLLMLSWRGGTWTGVERRTSEEIERRMEQASAELSKLTGKVQELMLLSKDVAVLQAQQRTSDRELTRLDQRLTNLEHQK